MIQGISNGYYNYQNIGSMQNSLYSAPIFTMQSQQKMVDAVQFKGLQKPEEESFLSKHWGKLLIGGALVLGAALTHGKLWGNTEKVVAKGGDAVANDVVASAGKMDELNKTRESAQGQDLIDITNDIICKATDDDVLLTENHKLLQYLEKAEKGELLLRDQRKIGNMCNIPSEKANALAGIAKIHAKRGNNSVALEFYQKSLDVNENYGSVIPSMMKSFIKENKVDDGIALAAKYLEPSKNNVINEADLDLIKALAEGLKTKGKTELADSFELLAKGYYDLERLTSEDFKKLAKVGLGKEQVTKFIGTESLDFEDMEVGAMSKWVLEQVNSLNKK